MMKSAKYLLLALLMSFAFVSWGQDNKDININYSTPKSYVLGGVKVKGNTYYSGDQIVQLSGLVKNSTIKIPGDELSSAINRLWQQKLFKDIAISVDSLSQSKDTVFLAISLKERPRIVSWSFSGIKSGEKKDLQERLSIRRGSEFSEYVEKTSIGIIKRFFKEKGFLEVKVKVDITPNAKIPNGINVNFNVDKGPKIRIKTIKFIGTHDISDYQLAKSMKKTKSAKIYNFFNSKKFNPKEYPNDKKSLISALNERGYRDAKIIKDTIYEIEPGKLEIDLYIDQGKKYYFRNINWTGNSIYTADELNSVLHIKKGDVYDVVTMQKRLNGGNPNDLDVSKLYRDNGYLFFHVQPVEMRIKGDSVDVEMRIVEGKQAYLNNIIITGNTITNEKIVRRQIFTRPGYLFNQSDFERSIREIASLGQFDPEAIMTKGYSIVPDQLTNTVDISYNVTEKPSSQFELQGGWGGYSFVGTVGVSFNNFSIKRIFDKKAWRPVPLGDAQNLAFRFQTNGTYYTALTASFVEPWLFGKKPTSLSISAYYTKQTNSYSSLNILRNDKQFEVFGFSAGLGHRLKWPDNYFVLYNQLSLQTYKLTNWYQNNFLFENGISNNLSYTISLSRNSTDQPIYPRQGSDITVSLQFTPPFSLFRKYTYDKNGHIQKVNSYRDVDYNTWKASDRFKWIEYHKWTLKATFYQKIIGDLVLKSRFQFGYLGYYNKRWGYSPFEGFWVGGDGLTGYNTYGTEVISLRGYENYSLTPTVESQYRVAGLSYMGNVYDKFSFELRYPIVLQPQSQIFVLAFAEGGNCWDDIKKFNPFQIKRSAGVGVRLFLQVVGMLGIDWAYGFDDPINGGSHFHFIIGQEF